MSQPLSEDTRLTLALIRKYPMIEGKDIAKELAFDMERVGRITNELIQRKLIGVQFPFVKETLYPVKDYLEIAKFYPN
jgi:hypothetical protein